MSGRVLFFSLLASTGLGLSIHPRHHDDTTALMLEPASNVMLLKRAAEVTPGERQLLNRISTEPLSGKQYGPEEKPSVPYFAKGKTTAELEPFREKLHSAREEVHAETKKDAPSSRSLTSAIGFTNEQATINALKRTPNAMPLHVEMPWEVREKLTKGPNAPFTDKLRYTPEEVKRSEELEKKRQELDRAGGGGQWEV